MSEPGAWGDQPLVEPLTDRELEILSHMAEHSTNQEIAEALILSLNTIKWYARQIYGKLAVDGRREAVSRARDLGLLEDAVAAPVPIQKLPAQLTPFLGRQEEMDRICELLSGPEARLVTIVGPGGMGKTRLAIEAAACVSRTRTSLFQDGVFFVRLAPLDDPSELAAEIGQAIGFLFYQAEMSPEQQLLHYLRGKHQLLVLDNFEHLIGPESARLLFGLLTEARHVTVLVTSRSRLNVQGEHVFPLAGMGIPEEGEVAQWKDPFHEAEAYSGVQLFLHSARRQNPGFEMTVENLQPIVRICSLVVGLPLGIELAAGWMAVLQPQQIEDEIARSLDILSTEAGGVPARQQSLRAVFDSSWRLLSEQERDAFTELAVFEGGFDLEAAQRISGLSLQILLALVNKSWVQQGEGGRFQFHDLLHHYGREKLAADPEREAAVRDRHSRHFCEWLSAREEGTWGPRQQAVLASIETDIENVRAACLWAAEERCVQRLRAAVNALGLFYYQGWGNYQAAQRTFRALGQSVASGQEWPAADRDGATLLMARILGWRATFSGLVGDVQGSIRLLDEGSAVLDRLAVSQADTGQIRAHLAWQYGYQLLYADPEASRGRFAESLALYREAGDRLGIASALLGLGRALRGAGAVEEAEQALVSSLALHRELGNQRGEGETLTTLGGLVLKRGRFEEAEELIQQSLSMTPETHLFGIAFGLGFLGTVRLYTGRFGEAEDALLRCVELHRELGVRGYGLHWSYALGRTQLYQGGYKQARTRAERIVAGARDLGYDRAIAMGLALHGEAALGTGAFAEAERYLRESVEAVGPDVTDRYEHGRLAMLGLAARGLGRHDEAEQQMLSALSRATRTHEFQVQMVALVGLALLHADEGAAERAVALYSLASRYGFVANSTWLRDIVGDSIESVGAGLSPAVRRAARERGAAADLDQTIGELLAGRAG